MKKSQAALEFLTTYAWAFIVIMVTIGALYYFGIFDFQKFLPERCLFPAQFDCIDFSLTETPSEVRFKLLNNLGEEIDIISYTISSGEDLSFTCTNPALITGWMGGEDKDFLFTSCSGGAYLEGERNSVKIVISYCAPATSGCPPHSIVGKITGIVT